MHKQKYDVIVIGAGAAGLMAAASAGARGRKVLLLEHSQKIGEKIRISGGGRSNFTNVDASPKNYLSNNPYFAISALTRYSQYDFIKLVESYQISYHLKTLGQLFCDGSSLQIINMLVEECNKFGVETKLSCQINFISKTDQFEIKANLGDFSAQSLIIATGGLSIPKMGASDFGYRIAEQFGLKIVPTRPALVPLTVPEKELDFYKSLSGISINSLVSFGKTSFRENILFTHRGLSGPAILQISSYLENLDNAQININLLPDLASRALFDKEHNSKQLITSLLKEHLPNRFVENWAAASTLSSKRMIDYKNKDLETIENKLREFKVSINGSEGYAKAEVTAGGIDTAELSSKTMETNNVSGLYFIGEIVDVTGWLGGYNFQWAWSSGYVAGLHA